MFGGTVIEIPKDMDGWCRLILDQMKRLEEMTENNLRLEQKLNGAIEKIKSAETKERQSLLIVRAVMEHLGVEVELKECECMGWECDHPPREKRFNYVVKNSKMVHGKGKK